MSICPKLTKLLMDSDEMLSSGSGTHSKGDYTVEMVETNIAIVWVDCIETECRWWDSIRNECGVPNMNTVIQHVHDSHEHSSSHSAATIPASAGGATSPPPEPSKASKLSQEYMTGEDTDGNSEILGKDFGLNVYDPDVPKMLLTILNDPNFPVGLTVYTWAEYLATLP